MPRLPLAFWLRLSPACLSASGGGRGQSTASYISSGIRSVLCSVSGSGCALEVFMGNFSLSLFFFSLWLSQFRLLSHVVLRLSSKLPQIVLRAFRPGPYPKHATHAFLFSPCSLVADMSIWATSPLGVVVRHVLCVCVCVCVCVFFPSQLCSPLRFQNSPQTRR